MRNLRFGGARIKYRGLFISKSSGPSPSGFITEWTLSSATTVTLPLTNNGTYNATVDWGDGSESIITSYNSTERIHSYSSPGVYYIEIQGECPGWGFNNLGDKLKITDIIHWGDESLFLGFSYLNFYGCTNLKSTGNGKIISRDLTSLINLFRSCINIKSLTNGMFDDCSFVTNMSYSLYGSGIIELQNGLFDNMTIVTNFYYAFAYCLSLKTIGSDLFKYNTQINNFEYAFYSSGLEVIPPNLFDQNVLIPRFRRTFERTPITSIPAHLFKYNTSITANGFEGTFMHTTGSLVVPDYLFGEVNYTNTSYLFLETFNRSMVKSVGEHVFDGAVGAGTNTFRSLFYSATNLTSFLSKFDKSTEVTEDAFRFTFWGCSSLEEVPADIFRYNKKVTGVWGFRQVFYECHKIQLNRNTFFADGEEATRFTTLPSFYMCFHRNSFSGVQGEAPPLWTCTFPGTPERGGCFGGTGNNSTSLSNYASIPSTWK